MSMDTKRFPLWQKPSSRVYLRHQAQNGFFGGASSSRTNRYPHSIHLMISSFGSQQIPKKEQFGSMMYSLILPPHSLPDFPIVPALPAPFRCSARRSRTSSRGIHQNPLAQVAPSAPIERLDFYFDAHSQNVLTPYPSEKHSSVSAHIPQA